MCVKTRDYKILGAVCKDGERCEILVFVYIGAGVCVSVLSVVRVVYSLERVFLLKIAI